MSKFIPPRKVAQEKFNQQVRVSSGLRSGTYVYAKNERGQVGVVSASKLESMGLTKITEEEYKDILYPKPVEKVAVTGTKEEPTDATTK